MSGLFGRIRDAVVQSPPPESFRRRRAPSPWYFLIFGSVSLVFWTVLLIVDPELKSQQDQFRNTFWLLLSVTFILQGVALRLTTRRPKLSRALGLLSTLASILGLGLVSASFFPKHAAIIIPVVAGLTMLLTLVGHFFSDTDST